MWSSKDCACRVHRRCSWFGLNSCFGTRWSQREEACRVARNAAGVLFAFSRLDYGVRLPIQYPFWVFGILHTGASFTCSRAPNKTSSERSAKAGEVGIGTMSAPVLAGMFQALQRLVARRVSLKTQSKKRLHSITVVSAACFLFPFTLLQLAAGDPEQATHQNPPLSAAWAYISTIVFGMLMSFYVDSFAEDRLRVHASSLVHFLVTAFSLLVLELFHRLDFSLLGFLICCSVLGLGIFEASSSERLERGSGLPYSKKQESTGNGALDSPYPI